MEPRNKKNKKVEYNPAEHDESDPPTEEEQFVNKQKDNGSPANYDGIPSGLEDMSETDAISVWIRQNCKFAQVWHLP